MVSTTRQILDVLTGRRLWDVVQGDCRELLRATPSGSVHLCLTSPPYWGLRAYGTDPKVWGGETLLLCTSCDSTIRFGGTSHELRVVRKGNGGSPSVQASQPAPKNVQQGEEHSLEGRSQDVLGSIACPCCGGSVKEIPCPHDWEGAFCNLCGAWRGELGQEPDPDLFVAHLVEIFREVRRTLRDDGLLWVNLGDSYSDGGKAPGRATGPANKVRARGIPDKSLVGIPFRFALAMIADGWVLRSDVIWHKINALPESVDNRPSKAHEYFLMFSKSNRPVFWTHPDRPGVRKKPKPDYVWVNRETKERVTEAPEGWRELTRKNPHTGKREKLWRRINLWRARDYYFDMDAIREPYSEETTWEEYEVKHQKDPEGTLAQESGSVKARIREKGPNPLGRSKRSVWSLPTESLGLDHFAAFPGTLIEPIILSGTSEWGVCPACGAPYTRVVKREPTAANQKAYTGAEQGAVPQHRAGGDRLGHVEEGLAVTVGWHPTCDCNAGRPVGAVVSDPFSGAGTSGREARRRDRRYLGFELNPRYVTMSKDRIMNDAPLLNFEWEDPEEEEEEAE